MQTNPLPGGELGGGYQIVARTLGTRIHSLQPFPSKPPSSASARLSRPARPPSPRHSHQFLIANESVIRPVGPRRHQERTRSFSDWAPYATGVLGAEEALLSSWGYRQDHLIDRRWQSKGRQGPEKELEECGLPAFIFGSSWFGFKFGLGFRDRFA